MKFLKNKASPWVLSFLLGVSFGSVALRSDLSRAESGSGSLPADRAFCAMCTLLGGADRGSAPSQGTETLASAVAPLTAALGGPFQVPDLQKVSALPSETVFWDPSRPLPGAFDPGSVDPTFHTSYYDPVHGLVDVPSAPWNLYGPPSGPGLFGGAGVRLTGFAEYPLPAWAGGMTSPI